MIELVGQSLLYFTHSYLVMVKEFRSIRISDKLVVKLEKYLLTREANDLGIETVKDALEHHTRIGMKAKVTVR